VAENTVQILSSKLAEVFMILYSFMYPKLCYFLSVKEQLTGASIGLCNLCNQFL